MCPKDSMNVNQQVLKSFASKKCISKTGMNEKPQGSKR